jgi:hypothetical protein
MSIKHSKRESKDFKLHVNDYEKSKHLHATYQKSLKLMTRDQLLKEYNKVRLLLIMMRNGKKIPPYSKGQDNIQVIKYKHNIVYQEMTNRNLNEMSKLIPKKMVSL